jgi:ABC-type branched-subunit amino acid transport system substrate-binding protein
LKVCQTRVVLIAALAAGLAGCPHVRPLPARGTMRVAVLAPFAGPSRAVGERVRRGVMLAGRRSGADAPPLELTLRDTGGRPEQAVRALEEVARDERVVAVVGPVLAAESLAVASRARDLGLPMVALSPADRLTALGANVFRCFLTPERQARALAAYAMERLRLRRFAILHPRTPYGESMRAAFAEEAMRRGGSVVATVTYPRGQKRFAAEARALRGVRMDALFFPDGYRTVALAVGYLATGGIPIGEGAGRSEVRLLGTNEWHSPELLRLAGRWVQHAVLTVGYSPLRAAPEGREFARAHGAAYGEAPGYVEAFAHDALRLVQAAVSRSDLGSGGLGRALGAGAVEGATGFLRFDAARELDAPPALVRVEGGSFVPVE